VVFLIVELIIDGETIELNEFVVKILSGMLLGGISSLRGIEKDWAQISINIKK
jgi:hypothetical protein